EVQRAGPNDQERGDLLVDRRLPTGRGRRRRRGRWLLLRRPGASVVAWNSVPDRREDLRGLASHGQDREDHDDDEEPGEREKGPAADRVVHDGMVAAGVAPR